MTTLAESIAGGDRRALARWITRIENDEPDARQALADLHARTGRALVVGITGAPGTGKSTLTSALARSLRAGAAGKPPQTVGILAVDPSSPFTGGAILGDRIRMRDLAGDEGVFIRSMASRGALGGLSRATSAAVRALDAAGFEVVLVETVGVGQDEVDIARQAHTVIVVETPGLGDDVQAIKAGILEIADILAVNKADMPGVESAVDALRTMLDMNANDADGWRTPIIRTVATTGQGVAELAAAIQRHRDHLKATGSWQRRELERAERDLEERLQTALLDQWREGRPIGQPGLQETARRIAARELSPEQAVVELLGGSSVARV